MRQKMQWKMPFPCNGVCLAQTPMFVKTQTPMFVKTHIDLLTIVALFKRLSPRLNMQSVVRKHTILLWFRRRGVTPFASR